MKEIKSVRVRGDYSIDSNMSGIGDYKVTLYEVSNNEYKVGVSQEGKSTIFSEYRKDGIYSNFSNDDFINDGIKVLIKKGSDKNYEIIQDPWSENAPKWRSFGFDLYYLNNGSSVLINWMQNDMALGGKKWSDDNGNELKISKGGDDKSLLEKYAFIFTPDNRTLKLTNLGIYEYSDDEPYLKFGGYVLDVDIINSIISNWKGKVPNYNLELCDPNYIKCEIIPFVSPVDELKDLDEELEEDEETPSEKLKLNYLIPENLDIKVNQDLPTIKVFVGDIPKNELPNLDGFDFGNEDDLSDELLDDEFKETDFSGLDESQLEVQEYPDEKTRIETQNQAEKINYEPYEPGDYVLDLIPGTFFGNNKIQVQCCQIDGYPVSIKIANNILDMKAAAKDDGVNLKVNSGFRPGYYPNINTKSESGVKVYAQSQEELFKQNCVNKPKCSPATAGPGRSKHGTGIAIDFNTGSRGGRIKSPLNEKVYSWLIKNSWKFGFVRTVASEEWHFEYWESSKYSGPYVKLSKSNDLFYSDLGLNNLQIA